MCCCVPSRTAALPPRGNPLVSGFDSASLQRESKDASDADSAVTSDVRLSLLQERGWSTISDCATATNLANLAN